MKLNFAFLSPKGDIGHWYCRTDVFSKTLCVFGKKGEGNACKLFVSIDYFLLVGEIAMLDLAAVAVLQKVAQ